MARVKYGLIGIYNSSPLTLGNEEGCALAVDSAGRLIAVGSVASGATDSGNPIKIGGVYNSTKPTLTNGQRGDIQLTDRGALTIDGSVAAGSTPIGNGVRISGVYRATPATRTDGQKSDLVTDSAENLKTTLGTAIAGEDINNDVLKVEQRFSYLNIPTQTTTTVKSGVGFLRRIIIPTQVASATVKIYDNTAGSGTVIMNTLTMPATLLSEGSLVIDFDCSFSVGLTIVTAGATMPLTAIYR